MKYYKVESSHWPMKLEFKSEILMESGQCFRITEHNGLRLYPTRFKVLEVLDAPTYTGELVEIKAADLTVEPF